MKAVILCGGEGTRMREETEFKPKALVEIGGLPIIWHVMKMYARHGINDFILAAGWKWEAIHSFCWQNSDALSRDGIKVQVVNTGEKTQTGGRLLRLREYLKGEEAFCATYCDGLSDVDTSRLIDWHGVHGKVATVTAVHARSRYGCLTIPWGGKEVIEYREKPMMTEWINGGFYVFGKGIFDYLEGNCSRVPDSCVFEHGPMISLVHDKELMSYQHGGYWSCMDSYKESLELNAAWKAGNAPWKTWD